MLRKISDPVGASAAPGYLSWKSDPITSVSFPGAATQTFVLAGADLPAEMIFVKAYLETDVATTSYAADTTGLSVDIGITGGENFYADAIPMMDAPAGRHSSSIPLAALAFALQVSEAYVARFTASGPMPRLNHVTFSGRIVLLYLPIPALETP